MALRVRAAQTRDAKGAGRAWNHATRKCRRPRTLGALLRRCGEISAMVWRSEARTPEGGSKTKMREARSRLGGTCGGGEDY